MLRKQIHVSKSGRKQGKFGKHYSSRHCNQWDTGNFFKWVRLLTKKLIFTKGSKTRSHFVIVVKYLLTYKFTQA